MPIGGLIMSARSIIPNTILLLLLDYFFIFSALCVLCAVRLHFDIFVVEEKKCGLVFFNCSDRKLV